MKNYLIIILGIIIATVGLGSAFAIQNESAMRNLFVYGYLSYFFLAFPFFITGIIVFFGGVAIAITGELYRRRIETREPLVCSSCGTTLQKSDKYCPRCGNEIK